MADDPNSGGALVPAAPGGDAVSRELAEIANVHRTEPARYWRDKDMQSRRLALNDAQLRGLTTPPARAPGSALKARKLDIEAAMRQGRNGPYYRSPEMQKEYRDIIDAELSGRTEIARTDTRPAASDGREVTRAEDWRATPLQFTEASPQLAERWGPQLEMRLHEAQDNLFAVLEGVAIHADPALAVEMENSFDSYQEMYRTPLRTS